MEGNGSDLNLVDSVDKDCKITMFGAVQYGTAHSANSPGNFRANYIKMILKKNTLNAESPHQIWDCGLFESNIFLPLK